AMAVIPAGAANAYELDRGAIAGKVRPFTLKAPVFLFQGIPTGGEIGGEEPARVEPGDSAQGFRVIYPAEELPRGGRLEIETMLQWSNQDSLWRKWARYRITGIEKPLVLARVRIDRIDVSEAGQAWTGALPPSKRSDLAGARPTTHPSEEK